MVHNRNDIKLLTISLFPVSDQIIEGFSRLKIKKSNNYTEYIEQQKSPWLDPVPRVKLAVEKGSWYSLNVFAPIYEGQIWRHDLDFLPIQTYKSPLIWKKKKKKNNKKKKKIFEKIIA